MINNKKVLIIYCSILLMLAACEKMDNRNRLGDDKIAPAPVTNVVVTNIPGGATFTYTPPADDDFLYVQATYKLADGKDKFTNSSFNKSTLQIEGFADTTEFTSTLVAVDKSGNKSTPVVVKFKPSTPPVELVYKSLKMESDFGGVRYTWDNILKKTIALLLFYKDETGKDQLIDSYYTDSEVGEFILRGRDTIEREYSVIVRDKWENLSDKFAKNIKPLYEEILDRTKFKDLGPTYKLNFGVRGMNWFWDNNFQDNVPDNAPAYPWNAAMDLGVKAKLSRVIIWQYSWSFNSFGHYYAGGNLKKMEIYGSNAPNPTNVIDQSWTLIRSCEIIKKSGLPINIGRANMSAEDYDIAKNRGHEFIVPLNAEGYRYIMLKGIEPWQTLPCAISEIQFYGQKQQ